MHIKKCLLEVSESTTAHVKKSSIKYICGSRGSCKSNKFSPVMSLSGLVALWVMCLGMKTRIKKVLSLVQLYQLSSFHIQQSYRSAMLYRWTAFQNLATTLPKMQLDIAIGNSLDHMLLPLEPQQALNYFFHMCSCSLWHLWTHMWNWWRYPLSVIKWVVSCGCQTLTLLAWSACWAIVLLSLSHRAFASSNCFSVACCRRTASSFESHTDVCSSAIS